MQQAHDFLKESKLLYELLLGRNESDYELITQFKNWSIQDVIGHLYLFNVAAIKTVDGPKSFDEFFIPFLQQLQKGKTMVEAQVPWLNGFSGKVLLNKWWDSCLELEKIYSKISSNALSSELLEFESNISLDDAKKSLSQNSTVDLHQEDAPVIKLLNSIFVQSIQNNASDIHFISNETSFDIQLRIDGSLVPLLQLKIEQAPRIITRIKTISKIK